MGNQLEKDYMKLRGLQKRAREEMWHLFSHHPEIKDEWEDANTECFKDLKSLVDWEPDDE